MLLLLVLQAHALKDHNIHASLVPSRFDSGYILIAPSTLKGLGQCLPT